MKRSITIIQDDEGYYTAFDGDRVADKMQDDEALGVVANWLLTPEKRMRYSTAIENYWVIEAKIRDKIEAQLRPFERLLLTEHRDTPFQRARAASK